MLRLMLRLSLPLLCLALGSSGCGSSKKSSRDIRREQIRANAEAKRQELKEVTGTFRGYLEQPNGGSQDVILRLDIKDLQEDEDGEIDPVMVPSLAGYLKFNFAAPGTPVDELGHFIGFGIEKAQYDGKSEKLDLNVANEEFKEIILDLTTGEDDHISGHWTAPHLSASGKIKLKKVDANGLGLAVNDRDNQLDGLYQGFFGWSADAEYQNASIEIKTTPKGADNLQIGLITRMFWGAFASPSDTLSYQFAGATFNPITGFLSFKDENADIAFSGRIENGNINGSWSNKWRGQMGPVMANKAGNVAKPDVAQATSLRGTYRGEFVKTNPNVNIPKRMQLALSPIADPAQRGGLRVAGGMRFYLGDFGSHDYIAVNFSESNFNFFTKIFTAKSTANYNFNLNAEVRNGQAVGELFDATLGKIGNFTLNRVVEESP